MGWWELCFSQVRDGTLGLLATFSKKTRGMMVYWRVLGGGQLASSASSNKKWFVEFR